MATRMRPLRDIIPLAQAKQIIESAVRPLDRT
jgi:hypothetical protein